uniref:Uncharacterized protein ycf35 n=1 Tax=Plocamium cartilagineum TaxID=31452 RepID=A0A1C9CHS7_PLOCA|nr:hypothetical protein Plocam_108 [Plocamium cartilagineum]AOM67944.1 hypothetical protein Plocam_108 [Plocamium cartilagineum]
MSHFSKIKTSIHNIEILQKTINDLGFECTYGKLLIKDSYGNLQSINLLVQDNCKDILGFSWDNNQYNIVADIELWNQKMSFNVFVDKILQQYALNSVLNESLKAGFQQVKKQNQQDGSIKIIMQRWS